MTKPSRTRDKFQTCATTLQLCLSALALCSVFHLNSADAQTARVVKVQGKRAIIKVEDGSQLEPGQILQLKGSQPSGMGISSGGRAQIIGGSASLSSTSRNPGSTQESNFSGFGRYGWNDGIMEYGPEVTFALGSIPGLTSRDLGVGGFFDYNLVENKPGTELVYGGAASASLSMLSGSVGNANYSGSGMTLNLGGQVKWFPFGNSISVRGDVFYSYNKATRTTDSTSNSLVATAGFYLYF